MKHKLFYHKLFTPAEESSGLDKYLGYLNICLNHYFVIGCRNLFANKTLTIYSDEYIDGSCNIPLTAWAEDDSSYGCPIKFIHQKNCICNIQKLQIGTPCLFHPVKFDTPDELIDMDKNILPKEYILGFLKLLDKNPKLKFKPGYQKFYKHFKTKYPTYDN